MFYVCICVCLFFNWLVVWWEGGRKGTMRERGREEDEGEREGNEIIQSIGEDANQWDLSYITGDSVN